MKKYVVFDMDGTLSDASGRKHHLHGDAKNWDAFFADLHLDPPIAPIVSLYNELCNSPNYEVVIFTGRPAQYRTPTERWMQKHGLTLRPIYCRQDGDQRHDLVVKREIYEDFVKDGRKIDFIVEDRNSVVAMWREMGITCLHCCDADF